MYLEDANFRQADIKSQSVLDGMPLYFDSQHSLPKTFVKFKTLRVKFNPWYGPHTRASYLETMIGCSKKAGTFPETNNGNQRYYTSRSIRFIILNPINYLINISHQCKWTRFGCFFNSLSGLRGQPKLSDKVIRQLQNFSTEARSYRMK